MKKYFSLIKACMTEDMNLFKVSTKDKSNFTKIILPVFLTLVIMSMMYFYSESMITELVKVNMEFVLLTLFIILTSFLTVIEGIYKSSNLLFKCKDDNMLFSLPIKKSTVLFIRVFKFYVFELLYNSLFLFPAIVVYARYTNPSVNYYFTSFIGLLLLPIIPIVISCIIGVFITFLSSKFKKVNFVQTIITVLFFLVIMFFSYNSNNLVVNIANNATSINDFITKIYYPAGSFIELVTNFKILKLLEFIIVNIGAFAITIYLIGKFYFNVNSEAKSVRVSKSKKEYKINTLTPIRSLIKKEFNRFVNSTVFITNAGFGLVLFIVACIVIVVKFDGIAESFISSDSSISIDYLKSYLPVVFFGLICFSSFMTSITSSMISLEGKSFVILKSLPIKAYTIVKSKILAAVIIMIPCIILGSLIVFIKFKFDLLSIILLLIASVLCPLLSETIGIMINLKYPKMDAKNDTEVVKQSMSSAISVFIGMALSGFTAILLFMGLAHNIPNNILILCFLMIYALIYFLLSLLLRKTCEKRFNSIVY